MRDERPYILEWVAFHRIIGFDQIVIYSNECSDGTTELLTELDRAGYIEHRIWPNRPRVSAQLTAYSDAVDRCLTRWICFIDADEFIVLMEDETIAELLSRFDEDVSAIALNWRLFGSAGEMVRRSEPVIERFTRAAPRGVHGNYLCKTIAVASDVEAQHIHRCFLKRGRYVNTQGEDIEIANMGFAPRVEHRLAQINHYVIKSRDEFADKRRRGNANRPPESPDKYTGRDGSYFAVHDMNDEEDTTALRFLDAAKVEMLKLESALAAGLGT